MTYERELFFFFLFFLFLLSTTLLTANSVKVPASKKNENLRGQAKHYRYRPIYYT